MKRILLLLLLPMGFLNARAQSLKPSTPDSLSIQASPQQPQIHALNPGLMDQLAREHQLLQEKLLEKLDKRNGFRGVTFGTHVKYFKNVVMEWKEGDDRNYRRRGDKLSINGMPLTEIVYGFHKNKLHHIYLTSPGVENSRKMLQFFQSIYGPGERVYEETVEFDNMVQWTGKKVILTYAEVASKKEGFFHFFVVDKAPELPRRQPRAKPISSR